MILPQKFLSSIEYYTYTNKKYFFGGYKDIFTFYFRNDEFPWLIKRKVKIPLVLVNANYANREWERDDESIELSEQLKNYFK